MLQHADWAQSPIYGQLSSAIPDATVVDNLSNERDKLAMLDHPHQCSVCEPAHYDLMKQSQNMWWVSRNNIILLLLFPVSHNDWSKWFAIS
jgi:hypothetical protein